LHGKNQVLLLIDSKNFSKEAGMRAAKMILSMMFCVLLSIITIVSANPTLTPGVWKNISPPNIPLGAGESMIAQGVAIDPANPSTIYWCNTPFNSGTYGGLFRSTDGGSNWTRIGAAHSPAWMGGDTIDEPLRVRIDPANSQHIYVGDGVRGGTLGFFTSIDKGANFNKPQAWVDAATTAGFIDDVYDVAVDPTDFKHILVSHHGAWKWGDAVWGNSSGVMESKDGGATWIIHPPQSTWGAGHSIAFLYNPGKNIGNNQTWLLGTQGDGYWRTTNSGQSWTKVHSNTIFHGGGNICYDNNGVLYASANPGNIRSTNNGATWTQIGPGAVAGTTCVYNDGTTLWTGQAYSHGSLPLYTSPATDGLTWTAGTQNFSDSGPYEMTYDATNNIIYASMWFQGIWAMKLSTSTTHTTASNRKMTDQNASKRFIINSDKSMAGFSISGSGAIYNLKGTRIDQTISNETSKMVRQMGIIKVK
jgi:hypothetical protein